MRRSPGFTAVAVLSLALGIGANATVFSVADKLLFSAPAQVANASGLYRVSVQRTYPDLAPRPFFGVVKFSEYFALKEQAKSFDVITVYLPPERQRLGRGPDVPRIKESPVSVNFFDVLGAKPYRGRFFLADDAKSSGSLYPAVISYSFWQRQYSGADSAIGAKFEATGLSFVIVGIAPPGFSGTELDAADTWVPLEATAPQRIDQNWKAWDGMAARMLVRLAHGVSSTRAATEATTLLRRIPEENPAMAVQETVGIGSIVDARGPSEQTDAVKVSTKLVVASALVLLAACANLANLLLVRALTRRREIALRLAVGVTRRRLMMQMLIESVMIALAGVCAALIVSQWSGSSLRTLIFPDMQWASNAIGWRVFAFASFIGVLTAVISTIAPAVRMTRADVASALRSAAPQLTQSTGRLRQGLLALQVALSVVLVIGAETFSKSLENAYQFDMGIDVERLLTARISLDSDTVSSGSRNSMYDEALRRVLSVPGVQAAALTAQIPLLGNTIMPINTPEGDPRKRPGAVIWQVTPELQKTAGFRLTRGRFITAADLRPGLPVPVLITVEGARTLWPNTDPIGRCVRLGLADTTPCLRVVGVVQNLRQRSIREQAALAMLVGTPAPKRISYVVIRTHENIEPSSLVPAIRQQLLDLRADVSALEVRPLTRMLDSDYRPLRLGTVTFSTFAVLTIILATIGLYGILSFNVTQRINEFGIRSALGAQARDLVASVVREGMIVVATGVVLGMVLSWYASTAIATLLFQSSA
ncbi:MAG: ABC transporter permease, partial [Gemmatimonas sp.]